MYLEGVYKLQYPTVDTITQYLAQLGKNAFIYKIDLARAFRQLPIDPHDYDLLCLHWKGAYYCDLFCPFGQVSGSSFCTRLTMFFSYLARQKGHVTYTYVDDVVGCAPDEQKALEGYQFLKNLLEELNFPLSKKKLVTPTQVANCLGIIVDTRQQTVSIPEGKKQEILIKCEEIYYKKSISVPHWITYVHTQTCTFIKDFY